jgi:hypothetical protein
LSSSWWYLICAAVFFFALALRIAHSRAGLPYIEDDTDVYAFSIFMNRRESLDPQTFIYPSLIFMFGFFVNHLGVFLANLRGSELVASNLTWGLEDWGWTLGNPDLLFLNRAIMGALGALLCLIVIGIGSALSGRLAGIFGGLSLAVVPYVISQETRFTVNGLAALFTALAALLSLHYLLKPRPIWIYLGFSAAALAAGTKYNAGVAVISPLVALAICFYRDRTKLRFTQIIMSAIIYIGTFVATTPFLVIKWQDFTDSVFGAGQLYFQQVFYGAEIEPGLPHLQQIFTLIAENIGLFGFALSVIGVLSLAFLSQPSWIVVYLPTIMLTAVMAASNVNRHGNHLPTYPVLAVGVGAGVSLFVGLWLVGRQNRWRGASLLAVPMVAAFVPVGLAVGGGFQQIATDWRYQDPRVQAIDVLATGQHGGNILIATELRVHPAERERLSGVASAQVLPLERITQCDFSPDTTLLLPTSVTTWREAAARRIGEIKPANELNTSLQRLISNATPSAQFGSNETVLDYNFTDPQLVIVKASDLTACA